MRDRKEVFAISGVTVPETDMDGEPEPYPDLDDADAGEAVEALLVNKSGSAHDDYDDDYDDMDDNVSTGAVIGVQPSPMASSLHPRHPDFFSSLERDMQESNPSSPNRITRPMPVNPTYIQSLRSLESNNDETSAMKTTTSPLTFVTTTSDDKEANDYLRTLRATDSSSSNHNDGGNADDDDDDRGSSVTVGEVLWPFPDKSYTVESSLPEQPLPIDTTIIASTPTDEVSPSSAVIATLEAAKKELDEHCETNFGHLASSSGDEAPEESDQVMELPTKVENESMTASHDESEQAPHKVLLDDLRTSLQPIHDRDDEHAVVGFGLGGVQISPRNRTDPIIKLQRSRLLEDLTLAVSKVYTRHHVTVETISTGTGKPTRTDVELFNMTYLQKQHSQKQKEKEQQRLESKQEEKEKAKEQDPAPVDRTTNEPPVSEEVAMTPVNGEVKPVEEQTEVEELSKPAVAPTNKPSPTPRDDSEVQDSFSSVALDDAPVVVEPALPAATKPAPISAESVEPAIISETPVETSPQPEEAKEPQEQAIAEEATEKPTPDSKEVQESDHVTETTPFETEARQTKEQQESAIPQEVAEAADPDEPSTPLTPAEPTSQATPPPEKATEPTEAEVAPPPQTEKAGESDQTKTVSGKKGKASKWKQRLAKKKGVQIFTEDEGPVTTVSASQTPQAESIPSEPQSPNKSSKEPVTSPSEQAPKADVLSSPVAEAGNDSDEEFSPSGKKNRRMSTKGKKWMKRLASKRGSKSLEDDTPLEEDVAENLAPVPTLATEVAAPATVASRSNVPEAPAPSTSNEPAAVMEAKETEVATTNATATATPVDTATDKAVPQLLAEREAKPAEDTVVKDVSEPMQAVAKGDTTTTTAKPKVPEVAPEEPQAFDKGLRNSFMAFDALLQQRSGFAGGTPIAEDEYSEYTIEESIANSKPIPPPVNPSTSVNDQFEEQSLGQSYMEYTVASETGKDAPEAAPGYASSMMMESRMFTAPKVANEPTITIGEIDDDEMTQLTLDNSFVEPATSAVAPDQKPPMPPAQIEQNEDHKKTMEIDVPTPKAGQPRSSNSSAKRDSINSSSHRSQNSSKGGSSTGSGEKSQARITEILRKDIWSDDEATVKTALENLNAEASRGSAYRGKIIQFGGVIGIIRAMETHSNSYKTQVSACALMTTLARDSGTQIAIGEMGGITAIVEAMTKHTETEKVQEKGCYAISNITRHRGSNDGADGAVVALCAAMTKYPNNIIVQAKAFAAVANLCMDNPVRLQELSDCGGMLAITLALQKPWPSKLNKHEAISNLSILLRCLSEHGGEGDNDNDDDLSVYSEQASVMLERDASFSVVSEIDEPSLAPGGYDGAAYYDTNYGYDDYANDNNYDNGTGPMSTGQSKPSMPLGLEPPTTLGLEPPTVLNDAKARSGTGSKSSHPTDATATDEIDDENCVIS